MDLSPLIRCQPKKKKWHPNLADGEAKDFLKIRWLTDEEQVEGPTAAKVGHDDGIHRHGGEEVTPWSLEFLWRTEAKAPSEWVSLMLLAVLAAGCRITHLSCTYLMHFFTNCRLNIDPLLLCYRRMLCRTSICQQEPRDIPYDPQNTYLWQYKCTDFTYSPSFYLAYSLKRLAERSIKNWQETTRIFII